MVPGFRNKWETRNGEVANVGKIGEAAFGLGPAMASDTR